MLQALFNTVKDLFLYDVSNHKDKEEKSIILKDTGLNIFFENIRNSQNSNNCPPTHRKYTILMKHYETIEHVLERFEKIATLSPQKKEEHYKYLNLIRLARLNAESACESTKNLEKKLMHENALKECLGDYEKFIQLEATTSPSKDYQDYLDYLQLYWQSIGSSLLNLTLNERSTNIFSLASNSPLDQTNLDVETPAALHLNYDAVNTTWKVEYQFAHEISKFYDHNKIIESVDKLKQNIENFHLNLN